MALHDLHPLFRVHEVQYSPHPLKQKVNSLLNLHSHIEVEGLLTYDECAMVQSGTQKEC